MDYDGTLPLSTDEISIWLVDTTTPLPAERLSVLLELLSVEEREELTRFRAFARRDLYLLARSFLRLILSRYTDIAPQDWRFSANHYGKPSVANPDVNARRLSFNMSHTEGLISLAVVAERDIGIDAEHPARKIDLDVSDHYFTVTERDALRKLPESLQKERFLTIWTLKESYIKARGMGLAIPLNKFGFRWREQEPVDIEFAEGFNDDPSRWRFWKWRSPVAGHHLALCVEANPGTAPLVVVRQTDLLGSEHELGSYIMETMRRTRPQQVIIGNR